VVLHLIPEINLSHRRTHFWSVQVPKNVINCENKRVFVALKRYKILKEIETN